MASHGIIHRGDYLGTSSPNQRAVGGTSYVLIRAKVVEGGVPLEPNGSYKLEIATDGEPLECFVFPREIICHAPQPEDPGNDAIIKTMSGGVERLFTKRSDGLWYQVGIAKGNGQTISGLHWAYAPLEIFGVRDLIT